MVKMFRKAVILLSISIEKIGTLLSEISHRLRRRAQQSKIVQKGAERSLYRTADKHLFWLNSTGHVDQSIIQTGVFEPGSTLVVQRLAKKGDVVLDVGANIGYYSILMSTLVGKEGKVICFEPTQHYGKILDKNIKVNNLTNVETYRIGLSNREQELEIQIGVNSATLHVPGKKKLISSEKIKLQTLDDFIDDHPLSKIDFIKIDVDGHEPLFLEGAKNTIDKYQPNILLEVSHPHYLNAGYTAWDFYEFLKSKGFYIYHEEGLTEITDMEDFLLKCGNFAYSANIVIARKKLRIV